MFHGHLNNQTFLDVMRALQYRSGRLVLRQPSGRVVEMNFLSGVLESFRMDGMPFTDSTQVIELLMALSEDQSSSYQFSSTFNSVSRGQLNIHLGNWLCQMDTESVSPFIEVVDGEITSVKSNQNNANQNDSTVQTHAVKMQSTHLTPSTHSLPHQDGVQNAQNADQNSVQGRTVVNVTTQISSSAQKYKKQKLQTTHYFGSPATRMA